MAVPKRKHSNRRSALRRRSNWKLEGKNIVKCPNCGADTLPHVMCDECGFYKKNEIEKK